MSEARDWGDPALRMTREEFYAWAEGRLGRYERINGVVVAMAPERAGHNRAKHNLREVMRRAIREATLQCEAFGDGMTVQIDDSDYEPDCVVHCPETRLPRDAVAVPDPLIVVEVLSPNTARYDRATKFTEYFRLPSVRHYLIVWPDEQRVVHHRRTDGADIETTTVTAGEIALSPPGIVIRVEDIYLP
ncbi:MAG TPA: Uma2 family endonuclease [Acetobacteraceae bacterium]|nr:Uma2 family endonuclease [Acetobacteraceae bacterium]